LRSNV